LEEIMKSLINAVAVAAALAIPAASFAQSNDQVTRAQVRHELAQLQKAGYRAGQGDQAFYPAQIEAATARVAAEEKSASGFGGVNSGSSASGAPATNGVRSLYSGR
jgi:type II secretory pathway pseudopilin PulG